MSRSAIYQPHVITAHEVERIRLLLSTYQDGTGQYSGGHEPGWRDFERVTALAFTGAAQESKSIFDVLVTNPAQPGTQYGISCKMRETLEFTRRTQRVVVEVSNASAKFEAELKQHGLEQNLVKYPDDVGRIVVNLIEQWNDAVSISNNGTVDLLRSFYLILSYSHKTRKNPLRYYQLHQFAPRLPDPTKLNWSWPVTKRGQKRLIGLDQQNNLIIEWYNASGGQLKYYPSESEAVWKSHEFNLEPLPQGTYGIVSKAAAYFPELWQQCNPSIARPDEE